MKFLIVFLVIAAGFGLFLFMRTPREVNVPAPGATSSDKAAVASVNLPALPEAQEPTSAPATAPTADLPYQSQLANPPAVVKAVYLTAWSAGSKSKISSVIGLIKRTELNAVVIDIKDYSGHVSYRTGIPEVAVAGADSEVRIAAPEALIKQLHDNGIYVIGRITVFQDPILAEAHPEWALHDKATGKAWFDKRGLAWLDAAAQPVWNYNLAIAKDALARGFDEINFDYIRFASDGDLGQISYPYWDMKTPRRVVIGKFFEYLRDNMPDAKLSADLFGLSTVDTWDDMGIGQVIEEAYKYFDYVCPMVYPSHYASGFMGYKNPALYPYEVIRYSLEHALARLLALANGGSQSANGSSTTTSTTTATSTISNSPSAISAKIRPWLQDFDLGAVYNASMVDKEIKAVDDVLASSSSTGEFTGWLLWDPANNYTADALQPK